MFVNELFPILSASISNTAKIVFISYAGHANNEGIAWPKTSRICELTGFRGSTVRHARSELLRAGLFERVGEYAFRLALPVVAKNARAAEAAPAPEPVREPAPVAAQVAAPAPKPDPAITQPTGDNPSPVAERETVQQPVVVVPTPAPEPAPAPVQQPVAKPQPEPAPAQPRAQQSAPAPVVAPVATQEPKPTPAPVATQKPAPMPALEPAPPAPRREIVSARVARLPDVDEAVRREVDARPVVKSSGNKEVDPELAERAKRLQKLCAENTARSHEQKAAAQRFEDGVTAATEQVAKQRAAQDIAAARQRAAQDAAPPAVPVTGQKPDEQPTPEKTTNGQNADAARDAAAREGCYPAGGKTNSPEPVAPDAAAAASIVLPVVEHESQESAPQTALPIICEPQAPAATPQQGELLPVPTKQNQRIKSVAVQGELLTDDENSKGCRLPKTWVLPRSWGIWAMEMFGFTEDQVRYQADKFRDHWTSTTRNPTKKDWFGTWRNWMRNANERGERFDYNSRPDQQKSKMTQALDNLANMKLDWEHQETWNPFAPPTPEETEAARKREEARAAARIAEAARMHEAAKQNGLIYIKHNNMNRGIV